MEILLETQTPWGFGLFQRVQVGASTLVLGGRQVLEASGRLTEAVLEDIPPRERGPVTTLDLVFPLG